MKTCSEAISPSLVRSYFQSFEILLWLIFNHQGNVSSNGVNFRDWNELCSHEAHCNEINVLHSCWATEALGGFGSSAGMRLSWFSSFLPVFGACRVPGTVCSCTHPDLGWCFWLFPWWRQKLQVRLSVTVHLMCVSLVLCLSQLKQNWNVTWWGQAAA